jgi:hypothetical protein
MLKNEIYQHGLSILFLVRTCGQPTINNVMRNQTLMSGDTARYAGHRLHFLQAFESVFYHVYFYKK